MRFTSLFLVIQRFLSYAAWKCFIFFRFTFFSACHNSSGGFINHCHEEMTFSSCFSYFPVFLFNRIRNTTPWIVSILLGGKGQDGDSLVVELVTNGRCRSCNSLRARRRSALLGSSSYSPQQI